MGMTPAVSILLPIIALMALLLRSFLYAFANFLPANIPMRRFISATDIKLFLGKLIFSMLAVISVGFVHLLNVGHLRLSVVLIVNFSINPVSIVGLTIPIYLSKFTLCNPITFVKLR